MSRRDAVYARQSVEKKDSLSLSGQLDLCRRAAGERELAVYQDAGYSGKNTDRPAFQKLMRDVQAGQIAAIYVYRLDRFSRSVADFGQLWQVLQAHQVEFVSVSENFDTSTPMGRAMLHIIMVFAQLERETIAQRVRDNYYRRAALGAWPGGPAPFGFSNGRAVGRDGRLAPALVPDENAALVRRIFAEYAAEGVSLSGLAKKLTGEGIPAPRRAVWDSVTLSRLLHNPAYVMADEQVRLHYLAQGVKISDPPEYFDGRCGLLLVGKREAAGRSRTDAEAQTLSVLGSLGLVEAPLFLRCQEKLQKNRQLGRSGQGRYTWLSGLLKCACCGYGISVTRDGARRYLHCSGRYNLACCRASIRVSLVELEQCVQADIEKLLAACPAPAEERAADRCAPRLAELDRQAQRLLDAFAGSPSLPLTYLQKALERLEQERRLLLAAQSREEHRALPPRKIRFAALSFEEKKAVAARLIRRINLAEDSAEIFWAV